MMVMMCYVTNTLNREPFRSLKSKISSGEYCLLFIYFLLFLFCLFFHLVKGGLNLNLNEI